MKIHAINSLNNKLYNNKKINSHKNFKNSTSFYGAPLYFEHEVLKNTEKITGKQAINLFEKFKHGLDSNKKSLKKHSPQREDFAFLDKIASRKEQKEFVNHYKDLTGFPNLDAVAFKIKKEFKKAVDITEQQLTTEHNLFDKQYYQVVGMGYDGISSVAKNKALPGSDLNGAYIIIKGADASDKASQNLDELIVNEFKNRLYENTDQRILSYNYRENSFPKIYTENQINTLIKKIEESSNQVSKIGSRIKPFGIIETLLKAFTEKKHQNKTFNANYVKANSFLLNLCKKFPVKGHSNLDINNPSRENIYDFTFTLEAMKQGEVIKKYNNYLLDSSHVINQLNNAQIYSLKNVTLDNHKYGQRELIEKGFNNWDVEVQFRLIKNMILKSYGIPSSDFPENYIHNRIDKFENLKKAIGL